ncbi:hypothetical protein [Amycolatopsis acidicola]|uniref:hypothetical protein n=1 Tax=Amycolatopsis acidicola TaxID=2596893 RepID=UPI001AA03A05|nr:hypothetical protein [Amycolatopsis acidicola]
MVLAPSMAGAVRSAGGWLFDHVMAGWDVMALVSDLADARPLQILGVRALDLEAALTSPAHGPRPHAVAVDARLYEADQRVRRAVGILLEQRLTEVWVWGGSWPIPDEDDCPVLHTLSVAARAFKAEALAAAAEPPDALGPTELFHTGDLFDEPFGKEDLVSIG